MTSSGPRRSVRRRLGVVALSALLFAAVRPFAWLFLDGTVYATGYSEARCRRVLVGMSMGEVGELAGPPLRRWSWDDGTGIWADTDQCNIDANYHRRWIDLRDGLVCNIANFYPTSRQSVRESGGLDEG